MIVYLISLGTFDVTNVLVSTSRSAGFECTFYPGSIAKGCLVHLTQTTTGEIFCRVVERLMNTLSLANVSLCPSFSLSNDPLSAGIYTMKVYDIESTGSVFPIPAIEGRVITVTKSTSVPLPYSSIVNGRSKNRRMYITIVPCQDLWKRQTFH